MESVYTDLGHGVRITKEPFHGVPFMNLSHLMRDVERRKKKIKDLSHLNDALKGETVTHVVGLESGGFPLGAWLADELNAAFVPIRKPGKLPPPVKSVEYAMEYREKNSMEIGQDAFENVEKPIVVICDDVVVTGGTLGGAIELVKSCGATVKAVAAFIDFGKENVWKETVPIIYNFLYTPGKEYVKMNNVQPIVMLYGKRYSGKDTMAEKGLHGMKRVSIGDVMKREYMKENPSVNLFDRSQKEKHRKDLMAYTSQQPFEYWLAKTPYDDGCVVTDLRTLKEIGYVKSRFTRVVLVNLQITDEERKRRGFVYDPYYDKSSLETELENYAKFDLILDNNDMEELQKGREKILNFMERM
jgi:adenine phosphoribosyltransferase